jgi:DNA-binding CsgD family transcriptional regulator
MTLTNSRPKAETLAPAYNYAAQQFNHLQSDLVTRARMWAMDEVGAAIAHQLSEPLTALLLYLHEVKERSEHPRDAEAISNSTREMVDKALCETERVCDIVDRMGHTIDLPLDADSALAHGQDAIDTWTRSAHTRSDDSTSAAQSGSNQRVLTPREREVLNLITAGSPNKEGAHRLGISTRTFEVHRAHIMGKLGARNAADLVRMALSEIR